MPRATRRIAPTDTRRFGADEWRGLGEQRADGRTAALGNAPIGPLLLRLSIPSMISMVVMSLYNIIDTLWVSGLPNGTEAIAALTVLMPLQMVAAAVGMGTGAGVTSLVSRRFGEQKVDEVNHIAGNAVVLPVLLGVGVGSLCLLFGEQLTLAFGGSRELVTPAVSYLTIVAWGFPFQIFGVTVDGLLRGAGNTKTPMYIRALVLTTMRGVVLVIPALLVLARFYGVYGAFAAQPASDIVGVFVAGAMLWQVYRRYPVSG